MPISLLSIISIEKLWSYMGRKLTFALFGCMYLQHTHTGCPIYIARSGHLSYKGLIGLQLRDTLYNMLYTIFWRFHSIICSFRIIAPVVNKDIMCRGCVLIKIHNRTRMIFVIVGVGKNRREEEEEVVGRSRKGREKKERWRGREALACSFHQFSSIHQP